MGRIREFFQPTAEFFFFSLHIQRRTVQETVRTLRRHFWPEVVIVISTAVSLVLLGQWQEWVSRLSAGLTAGLLAVLVLILLHYLGHLLVTPWRLFTEIETELARFRPQAIARPPRGLLDFQYDVERNDSGGRLQRAIEAIGSTMAVLTREANAATERLEKTEDGRKRRRAAKRLAKRMEYGARKLRRVHEKLTDSAFSFNETFSGFAGPLAAGSDPAIVSSLQESVRSSRASVKELRKSTADARLAIVSMRVVSPWNVPFQGDLFVSSGLMIDAHVAIEETLGELIESHDQILKAITKGIRIRQQAQRK